MNSNDLKKRTKKFAHDCVKLSLTLPKNKLGEHIARQLIRCSTSTAANYRATCLAQSKKSYISKLSIVVEEADESTFWLEFIIDEKLKAFDEVEPLHDEAKQLTSIFIASRKTATNNLNNIQ
ncbi:MAG: four helix bundle protein [Bacteroidales bacterium]|nr:four helix bundle protein [Bacteroidales bacterium]